MSTEKYYKVLRIEPNGDLFCEDIEEKSSITIDPRTDRGGEDLEEYTWEVGDVFRCETFPYIPCHFAKYNTIYKLRQE